MEHCPSDLLKPVEIIKNHNGFCESLAVKAMCLTQNLSYSNPKEEISSCNIDEFMATYFQNQKMRGRLNVLATPF